MPPKRKAEEKKDPKPKKAKKEKEEKKSTVKRPFIDGVIPLSIVEIARGKGDRRKHSDGVANWMHSSRATYSHFPPEAVALSYDLYLRDRTVVWDGTAGWGERHGGALDRGRVYVGYDISPKAIDNAKDVYGAYNNLGNTLEMPIIPFDGYFSCVPYWNLEKYEMDDGMDHCKTWEEFLYQYKIMFEKAVHAAVPGARFVVMVGDWRKNHVYYDLTYQTQKIFTDLGLVCFDMSILSHRTSMNASAHIPQSVRLGYTAKVHETVLVYDKPGNWEYKKLKLNLPVYNSNISLDLKSAEKEEGIVKDKCIEPEKELQEKEPEISENKTTPTVHIQNTILQKAESFPEKTVTVPNNQKVQTPIQTTENMNTKELPVQTSYTQRTQTVQQVQETLDQKTQDLETLDQSQDLETQDQKTLEKTQEQKKSTPKEIECPW